MSRWAWLLRRRRDDEGVILVIALLVVTTVTVVTVALLFNGSSNVLATVKLREVANGAYSGDAAAKIAIGDLVNGYTSSTTKGPDVSIPSSFGTPWVYSDNVDGAGCFGASGSGATVTPINSIVLKSLYPKSGKQTAATSARVECAVVPGTGSLGSGSGVPIVGSSTTARALTLLGDGTKTGDGLSVKPLGSGNSNAFRIGGGTATNAGITVSNGDLYSSGTVWARTGCSGTIVAPAGKDCSHAAVSVATPSANLSDVPTTLRNVANGWSDSGAACAFGPGYYDDADALTTATDACATSTFVPGNYYFDFHNNASDPTANASAVPAGSNQWTISNTVVGGVATGTGSSPGRCVSPIESTAANGVQFLFGGDSRMYLSSSATVELCGSYDAGNPPIVLYGLNSSGVSAPVSSAVTATTQSAPTTTGSTPAWTAGSVTAARVQAEDGSVATWPGSTTGSPTGRLVVTNLATPSQVPKGSMVATARLYVRHSEVASSGTAAKPTVKLTSGTSNQTFTPNARTTLGTDDWDVKTLVSKAVHDGTLSAATVELTETGRNTTFSVDAVRLVVTYYPPSLRGQTTAAMPSNCLVSGSCSFLDTKVNWPGTFVVNGVSYLPGSVVSIDPGNGDGLVAFRYGLIARGLQMKGQPQYLFGYPVVSIPDVGPGFGSDVTVVDLKVYLCVEQTSCASGGTLTLTARVKLTDKLDADGYLAPVAGERRVEVLSWSEQR